MSEEAFTARVHGSVGELPADAADERTLGLMMANVPLAEIHAQGRTPGGPA